MWRKISTSFLTWSSDSGRVSRPSLMSVRRVRLIYSLLLCEKEVLIKSGVDEVLDVTVSFGFLAMKSMNDWSVVETKIWLKLLSFSTCKLAWSSISFLMLLLLLLSTTIGSFVLFIQTSFSNSSVLFRRVSKDTSGNKDCMILSSLQLYFFRLV